MKIAMETQSVFLEVSERRLFLAWTRGESHTFRRRGVASVWPFAIEEAHYVGASELFHQGVPLWFCLLFRRGGLFVLLFLLFTVRPFMSLVKMVVKEQIGNWKIGTHELVGWRRAR